MGKTYLAAFDSQNYERVLFVAHREEILKQAAASFRNVRGSDEYGFFDGKTKCTDKPVIFASVATLGSEHYLNDRYFPSDYFQYVPYEISLKEAINKGMLVPFHYYGIYDDTDYSSLHVVRGRYDEKKLNETYIGNVHRHEMIYKYYCKYRSKRALGFCCSREHAEEMAREFTMRGIPADAEYPDDCLVDFDMRLIDLFKQIERKHRKVQDMLRDEYYRVKDRIAHRPTRLELFTYMDADIYQMTISRSNINPFKRYLESDDGVKVQLCFVQRKEINMEFTELIKRRRSVRGYEDVIVSHEDLEAILTQAQQAPSWKNSQTARCYVAETSEKLEELRKTGLPAFNQNSSTNAVLIVTTFVKDTAGFSNGKPDNDAGNYWGAYDLGLHDAYLILAASNAGYDTLIMGIRDAEILRQELDIPENEQIMSVIAIGKKAKKPVDKVRKDLGEVVRFF